MQHTAGLAALPAVDSARIGWPWLADTAPPIGAEFVAWPRITVVTPSYQQAPFLEECLRSVLMQNYPNLEYVVMDGGSTDGSADILRRYSPFLTHWQTGKDGGQGDAINRGFERASGEILCWLNSDDMFLPGAFFAVALAFQRTQADIVYGDALNLFEDDQALQYWQGFWILPSFLQFGGVISSHSVFWKRSIHVPLWAELNCNIDGELWQRLVPGRVLAYLAKPLGVCRIHGDTKSNAAKWREKCREDD
ncbi:MAG TPA: glycosyltransferase family 2 protein, partial [Opitutaceae bacterium]